MINSKENMKLQSEWSFYLKTSRLKIQMLRFRFGTQYNNFNNKAGQEAFRSVTRTYYKSSAAAIITYDISNRQSFLNIREWLENCLELTPANTTIVLAGNKCDLHEK